MLAEATGSLEAVALEHRHRAVVEKRPGDRAALGVLGIALHGASPEPRDLVHSARARGGGDPAAPVLAVDEEAGDPPIRKGDETVDVRAAALDARQLVGRPELTPADAPRAVVHERGVGPALPDSGLLLGSVLRHGLRAPDPFGVKAHAPAAAPHAVVALDQLREVRPGALVQRPRAQARADLRRHRRAEYPADAYRRRRARSARGSETTEGPHRAGPQHVNCQAWLGRGRLVGFRHVELGELVGEPGLAGAGTDLLQRGEILVEGRPEATQAVAIAEPKLGRDLVGVQQADVVHRARQRLGGLDLDPPVALEPRGGRDQLADDHVLLEAVEGVLLALERRVREDLGGLLERRGRQERVRVQRRLGDPEDDLLELRRLAAVVADAGVLAGEVVAVHELAREVGRVALLVDADLLEHLAHDQLDVLVVDVHALGLVDLLHLLDEVAGGLRPAAEFEQVVRVQRALVELAARLDLLALGHEQARAARERVAVLLTRIVGDDHGEGLVGLLDVDDAVVLGDLREALGLARLEELDDARQAVRDVRAGDAAGVERPHGQLRARLADRLRGDDAHRVADLGGLAGGHRAPVARLAHAAARLALEHRAHRDAGVGALLVVIGPEGLDDLGELGAVDLLARLDEHAAALGLDLLGGYAADEVVVGIPAAGEGQQLDVLGGAAVLLADDHVL